MSCELYWREGILRVECGEADPHRDSCEDCQHEHLAREAIICALPLLGAGEFGDPSWEAGVWARIARQERVKPHMRWFWGSMTTTACVLIFASWLLLRDREDGDASGDPSPVIELLPGPSAMRSVRSGRLLSSAIVGDQIRITVKSGDEVRIYHDNTVVLACPTGTTSGSCVSDDHGLVAEAHLQMPGKYALVVITPDPARRKAPRGTPTPTATLAKDLSALLDAGYSYQLTQLKVP
jgi:hypothetical protein